MVAQSAKNFTIWSHWPWTTFEEGGEKLPVTFEMSLGDVTGENDSV